MEEIKETTDNVIDFSTDSESVLINELYDEKEKNYMYVIVNTTDTNNEQTKDLVQNTSISFDKRFKSF